MTYFEIFSELEKKHSLSKEMIADVAVVIDMVEKFFGGDVAKTILWFNTKNPMLGGLSPNDMIRLGKYENLRKFITSSMEQ